MKVEDLKAEDHVEVFSPPGYRGPAVTPGRVVRLIPEIGAAYIELPPERGRKRRRTYIISAHNVIRRWRL